MRFYQYATGRASFQGYGFVAQTQGINFDNSLFQRSRDLSLMPEGSVVYELHSIDPLHTALIMTRVNAFGSGRYCYSHALITEQAAEPGQLARLLQPQSFLDNQSFLALESAKARGEAFSSTEFELPQVTHAQKDFMQELESKKNVLYAFLGYLWHLCYLRSQGERTLQPAILVLPKEWPTSKVVQFYTDCILPALPGDMRHHASVVIGASPRCFGEFPSNTSCLILQERTDNLIPMFDLNNGVIISSDAYTNDLVFDLGKSMIDDGTYPLTHLHRRQLQDLPASSVNDFSMAYAFQHLDRLAAQKKKDMRLYRQFFLTRYRELAGMVRNRYGTNDYRTVLVETERTAFLYWAEVNSAGEESPPELYADLVQKALTTTNDALWQQYLSVLGHPCRLADNETELSILLGQGRWKLSEDKRTLEQLNPQRFALLLSGHIKQADASMARTLLKALSPTTLSSQQLRKSIAAIIQQQLHALPPKDLAEMLESPVWQADERADILKECNDVKLAQSLLTSLTRKTLENAKLRERLAAIIKKNLSSLQQSEFNSILSSPVWQDAEKVDIIKTCVADLVTHSDPRDALAALCSLLKNHPYEKALPMLLECAQKTTINAAEADRLAETLILYANEVKTKHAASVLALFTEEHHRSAISALLRELFRFDYDRRNAPLWAEVESYLITQAFASDLRSADSAEVLLQVGRSWSVKAQKVHHYEWASFTEVIPQAEKDVRRISQELVGHASIADLFILVRGARDDWFGIIVTEEVSNHLRQNIKTMLTNPQNFNQMDQVMQLAEHIDRKLINSVEFDVVRLLSDLRSKKPFELLTMLDNLCPPMNKSGSIGSYIRHQARTIKPDTLAWEIVYELMAHWGDSRAAWDAFFKGHEWSPEPKTSPWKDDLYPMIALRHVCKCMMDEHASRTRKEELMRFVTTAPAWSRYVRLMENKREHLAFIRDEKIATPSLRGWLALHLSK